MSPQWIVGIVEDNLKKEKSNRGPSTRGRQGSPGPQPSAAGGSRGRGPSFVLLLARSCLGALGTSLDLAGHPGSAPLSPERALQPRNKFFWTAGQPGGQPCCHAAAMPGQANCQCKTMKKNNSRNADDLDLPRQRLAAPRRELKVPSCAQRELWAQVLGVQGGSVARMIDVRAARQVVIQCVPGRCKAGPWGRRVSGGSDLAVSVTVRSATNSDPAGWQDG